MTKWFCGRYRMRGWPRWFPVFIGPTFTDPRHPFRTASGVSVNFGPFAFYVFRGEA